MNINTDDIFRISNPEQFEELALKIFRFQASKNTVYAQFIEHLGINANNIVQVKDIPFLPVSFFKSHRILTPETSGPQIIFSSSATTGTIQSKHYVQDVTIYKQSFIKGFEYFFGHVPDHCIIALLPSYQEREGSSLIYMVDELIKLSGHPQSGYFLHENEELVHTLSELGNKSQKTILIGVTYALLDLAEEYKLDLGNVTVMETGGMKGRRKEMVRQELHDILCTRFGVENIASEYGMTELLAQAYSTGKGIFHCPPWLRVVARDTNDPMTLISPGQSGGLNIMDLTNIYSCSFIATQDLGKVYADGSFEVLGRFDNSDIRGCNLLVQ